MAHMMRIVRFGGFTSVSSCPIDRAHVATHDPLAIPAQSLVPLESAAHNGAKARVAAVAHWQASLAQVAGQSVSSLSDRRNPAAQEEIQ